MRIRRPLTAYRHVMWDWNGTLLDDVPAAVDVMNVLLARRGLPLLTIEAYKDVFDFPVIDYYVRLGFDFTHEPWDEVSVEFMDAYKTACYGCQLHEGAEDILRGLRDTGMTQSILSAAHVDYLEHFTRHFGIRDYFARILGLDHIEATSKIQLALDGMAALRCAPGEVLLIGDTTHDYEVAQAVGCDCILVACGHHTRVKLEISGVPVAETLEELRATLDV